MIAFINGKFSNLFPDGSQPSPLLLTALSSAGHQGPVSGSQGLEEAVVEVPHEIYDVVSEARGAEDHH